MSDQTNTQKTENKKEGDESKAPAEIKDKFLVVEDSATNRTVLKHLLIKMGFDVIECENGQKAWDVLSDEAQSEKVVAVVSDIMMPEMDGIELLNKVRGDSNWQATPFILVTAVMDKAQILEAKRLKVNGYILKPVTFERVSNKIKELFPDRRFPRIDAA